MANIKFYYDETEHSRSLNLKTITADEFYDGFVTAIVGWDEARESELEKKYRAFEEGYRSPQATELKSTALAKKQSGMAFIPWPRQMRTWFTISFVCSTKTCLFTTPFRARLST